MQEVLGVMNTVLLLDRVLDTVHARALTGGGSGGGTFLHTHGRSSVIRASPRVRKTRGIAVEEEDDFLEAGLKLRVDKSVYDRVDGGVAEEKPVKRYFESGVDFGKHSVRPHVEEDVEGSTPHWKDADQQTDDYSKHRHCSSDLLSVHSTL